VTAIHWGAQVYSLGTVAVVFALGRMLFSPVAALAAAAFAAILIADHSVLGNAANTELFMILPLAAAFAATLLAERRDSLRWSLAAGALSAAAVLFKQIAATNLLFCLGWIVWTSRRRWLHAAAFAGGVLIALAPVLLYFSLSGAWSEFIDSTVGHNLRYSVRLALADYPAYFWIGFRRIAQCLWPIGILALAGLAAGGVHPLRGPTAIVAVWGFFAFAGVSTGGYFRAHYFMQLIPAVALLAGHGADTLGRRLVKGGPRGASLAGAIAAVALLAVVLMSPWYYLRRASDEKCRRIYGDNPFPESIAVGKYIAEHSLPEDTVFILGSEPQILFYAARKSASRYMFVYPLMGPYADAAERQREVIAEIERNRPKFLVTVFVPVSFAVSHETHREIFNRLCALAASDYRVVGVTPYRHVSPIPLVTGDAALSMWRATPMTYDGPTWASLVIWERVSS
jgi:hypothetical protein